MTRQEEIDKGCDISGAEGVYWRFIKKADTAKVFEWISGERIRGTPPEQVQEIVASIVADIVFAMAQQVRRAEMKPYARGAMMAAAEMIDASIGKLSTESKKKTAIHLVKG